MPVPQRVNFLVGGPNIRLRTGKMPVPQRVNFLVGWAGEPAHERLIDKGSIFQFILAYLDNLAVNFTEFDVSSHRQSQGSFRFYHF